MLTLSSSSSLLLLAVDLVDAIFLASLEVLLELAFRNFVLRIKDRRIC